VIPRVSIIILNYNSPEIIDVCLRTLPITTGVDYEVVVVDNGSEPNVVDELRSHQAAGRITTLVCEPENHFFSEGNNIGVRHSNSASEYILLLNSDVGFLREDWLIKQIAWMEGTVTYKPSIWGAHPTRPSVGPRDIVSIGWSHDASVEPSHARPEGWCCMIRRSLWRDMSPDLPWHGGFEEMIGSVIRDGAKCGVLSQYAKYLIHREGGSGQSMIGPVNRRQPNMATFFGGLDIETLDFTLGPTEHDSYLSW
jgi:glycosyltransferase involved in cell wall biosynthesis